MTQVAYLGGKNDAAPWSVEAEQMVLGAILLGPERVGIVSGAGGAELFYEEAHADLYKMIARRERDGLLVSPVALADEANSHDGLCELGGSQYLARLAGAAIAPNMISDYVDLLSEYRSKRNILAAASEAQAAITKGDDPASVIAGRLEASLIETDSAGGPRPVSMMKAVTDAMQQSWSAYQGDECDVVRTGIPSLDRMVSGLYPGELILLGGRPSMGKTAVALSIGLNVARTGQGVVICSLEMNPEAMALRALSEATALRGPGITYADMRRGNMDEDQMQAIKAAAREVAELPITFLPRQYADLGALYSGAKQAKRTLGDNMRLLVVDYAQLLRSNKASRYDQITEISMALKNLAGQLNIPVLALSQLSRSLESREDKRPMLSDLRESGQLEQDADAVLFCYRDEYYLEREEPDRDNTEAYADWVSGMESARNRLDIIVAKQRQGQIGTARVRCNPAMNLIWEDGFNG